MKYIVFITTNLKTGQIFIGVHPTTNPEVFDGYLGSGVNSNKPCTYKYPKTPFQCAVKKYGVSLFKRYVLFTCDTLNEAINKKSLILTEDFCNQPHVYNTLETDDLSKIFQFDKSGNLINTWECNLYLTDLFGYPFSRFKNAIQKGCIFLNSYWSDKSRVIMNNILSTNPYYVYNTHGKLVKEYYDKESLYKDLHLSETDSIKDIINFQSPINDLYISNKLTDSFEPKARKSYSKRTYYIYDKDSNLKGIYKGKEVMRILDVYSWNKIQNIIEFRKGWYKDQYVSLEKVDKVPELVQTSIDVYDTNGKFIEKIYSIDELKKKYCLTNSAIKRIQKGDTYFENYMFKYNK